MHLKTPLLTILIPTYNRAFILEWMLESLLRQLAEVDQAIEVVIADNASTDATGRIVEQARRLGPLRYHRRPGNLGCAGNLIHSVREWVRGEFCWILGDDDMVIRGALPAILQFLESNRDVDHFFVNYAFKTIEERDRLIRECDSHYQPEAGECCCESREEKRVERWEEHLLTPCINQSQMFTAMMSHIFRTSAWRRYDHLVTLTPPDRERAIDADNVFPHVKILARAMVGRPSFYIGTPHFICGVGSQEWTREWPAIKLMALVELLDYYEALGVERSITRPLRRHLLGTLGGPLRAMWFEPATHARESFSLRRLAWSNRACPGAVYRLVAPVFCQAIRRRSEPWEQRLRGRVPRVISRPLRRLKDLGRKLLKRGA